MAAGLGVGRQIHLSGRIQSREYIKMTDQGQITKTAFEISAMTLEELRDEEA